MDEKGHRRIDWHMKFIGSNSLCIKNKKDDGKQRLSSNISQECINDFGVQWTAFQTNDGYYSSPELFEDILGTLVDKTELKNKIVADIGSGTGRIVLMLLTLGVEHVFALEPSVAYDVLKRNTSDLKDKISYINRPGDQLNLKNKLDFIFSLGVIHHIPDPDPVIRACYKALKPGGKIIVWLYGKENNSVYLFFLNIVRKISDFLPHRALVLFAWGLLFPLLVYAYFAKIFPLPLRQYLLNHFLKLPLKYKMLTIYDQLNPSYAKYYEQSEAEDLMRKSGFKKIESINRHGYSWTVKAEK